MPSREIEDFIARWSSASPSERANAQLFLVELCDLLGVPRPDPKPGSGYSFEFPVTEHHPDGSTSEGRIDLYKRGDFLLEAKQFQDQPPAPSELHLALESAGAVSRKRKSAPVRGTGAWDDAMLKARGQAERYVRALPPSDPNPPFLLTVDVGNSLEVFADFTQAGRNYLHFPHPQAFRIRLDDLRRPEIRERLRLVWTDPLALDPARHSAAVTCEISDLLAKLAKSLEQAGHAPRRVADFLCRCLFCMFAEDVGLLPAASFTHLLDSVRPEPAQFQPLAEQLFREMNTGTSGRISVVLRHALKRFNGGLFADATALDLDADQIMSLHQAAQYDWKAVEPAIFGTLLQRALDPAERHKLGAEFTPRAYVERLVLATVIEPLRAEWAHVRAAAYTHARAGRVDAAIAEIRAFHHRLCTLRILDPACGSGNFLYVTFELLKRLEMEILDELAQLGDRELALEIEHFTVHPRQFFGLELNPRAAAIAELVLWIGYLQWQARAAGSAAIGEPVLEKLDNIQCRDAVLAYDGEPQPVTWAMAAANPNLPGLPDEVRQQGRAGSPASEKGWGRPVSTSCKPAVSAGDEPSPPQSKDIITVWDRRSQKTDLVTGRQVPDETKRVPLLTYVNPRPAEWPLADYQVGNPPFLGTARMREDLGDGYAETLRATYPEVPESADFVLYWWYKAAELVRAAKAKRFGLITTNSLRQTFARRVVQAQLAAKPPLALVFAIPDHPWVDTAEGAAVRIAMTVGTAGEHLGELLEVTNEQPQEDGSAKVTFVQRRGRIQSGLTIGADVIRTSALSSNERLAYRGMQLIGSGFIVTPEEASALGLGRIAGLEKHIRPYRHGRDLTDEPRGLMVIDLFGLASGEVRQHFPDAYQHVLTRVKPERDQNNREAYRRNWWIHGEPRKDLRPALAGLRRYMATVETSKHRTFLFLTAEVLPDNKLVVIALDDAFHLGVLSSRAHLAWALSRGALLEDRPVYHKTECFDPFPFPACDAAAQDRIRRIAEELDAHRKRVQAQHPGLTLTGMYNVLEKLRAGEALNPKERQIHDAGLVSVLRQLHDDLDAAVFAAYSWPATLTDAEILERVVALNAERAKEESSGLIRWLRPEYQNPEGTEARQAALAIPTLNPQPSTLTPPRKLPWPKTMAERVKAVNGALALVKQPVTAADVAKGFARVKAADVGEILETLCTMGHARRGQREGTFLP